MELKQYAEASEKARLDRFNRTFMELKPKGLQFKPCVTEF